MTQEDDSDANELTLALLTVIHLHLNEKKNTEIPKYLLPEFSKWKLRSAMQLPNLEFYRIKKR